jgi:hypothetical protein
LLWHFSRKICDPSFPQKFQENKYARQRFGTSNIAGSCGLGICTTERGGRCSPGQSSNRSFAAGRGYTGPGDDAAGPSPDTQKHGPDDGWDEASHETGAEQSFREQVPDPTPKQLEALHGMIDDAMADMPMDDLLQAMVPIYRRHLTKSDIEEMIRFFGGPVGQKLLREQPQMMQEGMQVGMAIQQKRMEQIKAKVKERAQKLAEADEERDQTPKK